MRADSAPAYRPWVFGLVVMALTAVAYLPAWNGKPIWDDNNHVTPPELRSVHGLVEIWTQPEATRQYYPLVYTVFWIEHKLWADSVLPYHLVNILLHSVSALLLFKILVRLRVPGAWLAAAIFALHPVQVESVAWISELKNTLSGTFFLSSALIYFGFDQTRRKSAYVFSLVLFLFGLMCKTVVAPLPAVILIVLWWKRGEINWKHDVRPSLPFFGIGLGAGLFTAWVERNFIGAQGSQFNLSILDRCLIAGRDFWFYLFKLAWPEKLIFIYPRWQINHTIWWQYLFPVAALLLLAGLWKMRTRWRGPLAATLVFGVLLFPTLGFLNVYPFLYSFVADHFQYLACIAPIALVAAGLTTALNSVAQAQLFLPRVVYPALLILLGTLTWRQTRQYADIETLWRTTIARNPDCWMAHSNLGLLLLNRGNTEDAIAEFDRVLGISPDQAGAHRNLGNALMQKGSTDAAMAEFRKAVEISPDNADARNNLGIALLQQGAVEEAITNFEKAIQLRPAYADAHSNLGNALLQQGDIDRAIREYQTTLELPFDEAEAHYNIANALRRKGEVDAAIDQYRKALAIQPNYTSASNNLANSFRQKGLFEEAIREYEKALRFDNKSVVIQTNLAWMLATCFKSTLRDGARAVQLADEANRLSGGTNPVILHILSAAYAENGEFDKAIDAAERALEMVNPGDDPDLAASLQNKIALYRAGSPYHEPPP